MTTAGMGGDGEFLLADYKGKFEILMDRGEEDEFDVVVGTISGEEAIRQAPERMEIARWYGIPAYIGKDEEVLRAYKVTETP